MTITEFLMARLDEDEATAQAAQIRAGDHWLDGEAVLFPEVSAHIARYDPARALRDVAAGRAILAECEPRPGAGLVAEGMLAQRILRIRTAVYGDHPDYDPAWSVA